MVEQSRRPLAWARVYPALKRELTKYLRHGAWYPVVRDDQPDRISLQVGDRTVVVPRRMVEVRHRQPTHFSVISRLDLPPDQRSAPGDLGKRYAVCPRCSSRSTLFGQPPSRDCPDCGHTGEVGWWES